VSRVQLALNVADVDAAVEFYRALFATEPAKLRPGYASFAVADPPLKLVLIENRSATQPLNHLGVERASTDAVHEQGRRLAAAGVALEIEEGVTCCHALQDKHWVTDPDGQRWENYVVLADAPAAAGTPCCS
jgi:catechol 2,3-dioxygenase-like lactoylglutathione lyase family enzyme